MLFSTPKCNPKCIPISHPKLLPICDRKVLPIYDPKVLPIYAPKLHPKVCPVDDTEPHSKVYPKLTMTFSSPLILTVYIKTNSNYFTNI